LFFKVEKSKKTREFPLDILRKVNYYSAMNSNSLTTEQDGQGRNTRRRERTRSELLLAARRVFAERGYHEASIAEITQAADVGVGTFYLYFRDKDEAFNTLVDEGFRTLRDSVAAIVTQQGAVPNLPVLVTTVFRHAYEQRDLFQIALTGEASRARTFRAQAALAEALTRLFETVNGAELLPDSNASLMAHFVTGVIKQGIFWWFEHDEPGPEQMAEQVLRLLQYGLPRQLFE
jgi:AcrR family transcriptional regulator